MIKLKMKNYNMILTKKQQKYQHYHPEKLEKSGGSISSPVRISYLYINFYILIKEE